MSNDDKSIITSNLEYWTQLQDEGDYFENHPIYQGLREFNLREYGGFDAKQAISAFTQLQSFSKVVVIGCGYGRDTLQIAPYVAHVWGIDVSAKLLEKTTAFLLDHGIQNFTPVLASEYAANIPSNIDLVFSVVVMQHLTRDLVRDYFVTLGKQLACGGVFVVQFLEELYDGVESRDAELKVYEPSVSWTVSQLAQLASDSGLKFEEVRTQLVNPKTLWHWVHFSKI
ncbi:hypothetical protein MTYM_02070 [Methylococcales bacterium]|nr:hypothetical protein MTYM_02070 [Methylococcales bacterium]